MAKRKSRSTSVNKKKEKIEEIDVEEGVKNTKQKNIEITVDDDESDKPEVEQEKFEVVDEDISSEEDDEDAPEVMEIGSSEENDEKIDEEDEEIIGEEEKDVPELKEVPSFPSDGRYHNKQRCLVLCSRGVTARYRHLLEDLRTLIPHHKKESKLDVGKSGSTGKAVTDIAEMKNCNTVLYLECRKRQDCYMWIGRSSEGPSAKFLLNNVHTMDELRMTGNCMKGSRPVLTFDSSFNKVSHLKLLKSLFTDVFGTPRGHPKSKPFIDRIMAFYYADGMIWVRHYQIMQGQAENAKEANLEKKEHGTAENTSLVEIGPRFVLNPIRIFRGSFGGQTLYQNPDYVSPNEIRAKNLRAKGNTYFGRKQAQNKRKTRKENVVLPEDPLAHVFN